ncbi:LysR substrate-binding domain-containing protein [Sciscionella marina]|uniref:LysR substrate-binding domain-containing protein n=1 Tax=Sciscionella marina TaxID=508770 RepID=UPI0003611E06|nr:LysR substrate-binding domain-containing protein [Sciscionella marina]
MGIDLRKLDQLVVVAEEGSFTKAANRLHLSQQALSTSIRSFEREVGVPLLARDPGGVTALPAGQALIEDARVLHGLVRAALERARRIGREETEPLRIGHTPAVTGEEIAGLLRSRLSDQELSNTEVFQRYPAQLLDELYTGRLDLGLCRGMPPPQGIARETLGHDRLCVAVAAEHRLAGREYVELAELAEEPIMVWGRPGNSGYTDFLLDQCRRAGFEPRYTRNPIQGTPPVTAVIGTGHVAFVTAPPGPAAGGKSRVLELRPALHAPLHALWSPHITNELRDAFLAR